MAVQVLEQKALAYEHGETRELVALVKDAAQLVQTKGETAFSDFRLAASVWRQEETYVFVLDPNGNMVVHPDPALEGKNTLALKDIGGRPIIRRLIDAATIPGKPEGWYHYEWPVPGGLLPRWKSSYVRLVKAPSGASYIVGSGMYNDRMERAFVVDMVNAAVAEVEKRGEAAYPLFRDPTGPFIAKDAYVFVLSRDGIEVVNPGFPTIEGQKIPDVKETHGKLLGDAVIDVVQTAGSGWVDYMWPKPGESVSTQKSTYVTKATIGDTWVVVGCGVYLADAPKTARDATKMTAPQLMRLVREAAAELEKRGEDAYGDLQKPGSKWLHDDTYFFVMTMDAVKVFEAARPAREDKTTAGEADVLGRPIRGMFQDVGASPAGEGWVHYMYPLPGNLFPAWKSTFVKRVTFPSGKQHLVASGIYNMEMNAALVEDVVNRAADLVWRLGKEAFPRLRDRKGPFVFMDTYVFVQTPEGTELVNPAQPSLEGRNLMNLRDLKGKAVVQEEVAAALKDGSAWLDCYWYKPGDNTPALKRTYVKKVQSGSDTYIVGSGVYME